MKYLTLAALTCGTIVGLALGAQTAAPSKKTPSHAKGLPKTALPKSNLPHTSLPKTNLPKTNLPGHTSKPKTTTAPSGKPVAAVTKRPAAGTTRTATGHRTTYNSRYANYRRPVHRYSAQQMAPTADRYREIQDALAAKGYLKTPPTGVWDADSIDAMQRFQKDQNLDPTGKLTARSLSGLGLGPKTPEATASLGASSGMESTPLQ